MSERRERLGQRSEIKGSGEGEGERALSSHITEWKVLKQTWLWDGVSYNDSLTHINVYPRAIAFKHSAL